MEQPGSMTTVGQLNIALPNGNELHWYLSTPNVTHQVIGGKVSMHLAPQGLMFSLDISGLLTVQGWRARAIGLQEPSDIGGLHRAIMFPREGDIVARSATEARALIGEIAAANPATLVGVHDPVRGEFAPTTVRILHRRLAVNLPAGVIGRIQQQYGLWVMAQLASLEPSYG